MVSITNLECHILKYLDEQLGRQLDQRQLSVSRVAGVAVAGGTPVELEVRLSEGGVRESLTSPSHSPFLEQCVLV